MGAEVCLEDEDNVRLFDDGGLPRGCGAINDQGESVSTERTEICTIGSS